MNIRDVIRSKGADVITIGPDRSVSELVELMGVNNIGAVVVSADGRHIDGIVSERDVVRHLGAEGVEVLEMPVGRIMSSTVQVCHPDDPVDSIAETMTNARVRHLPVVDGEELVAIISIGDVVKSHISELVDERNHLIEYLHA